MAGTLQTQTFKCPPAWGVFPGIDIAHESNGIISAFNSSCNPMGSFATGRTLTLMLEQGIEHPGHAVDHAPPSQGPQATGLQSATREDMWPLLQRLHGLHIQQQGDLQLLQQHPNHEVSCGQLQHQLQQHVLQAQQKLLHLEEEEQQLRCQLQLHTEQQQAWGSDQLQLLHGGAVPVPAAAVQGVDVLATAPAAAAIPATAPASCCGLGYDPWDSNALADPDHYLQALLQAQSTYHDQQQQLYPNFNRALSSSCLSRASLASLDEESEGWDSSRPAPPPRGQQQQQGHHRGVLRSATWASDRFSSCKPTALAELAEEEGVGEAGVDHGRHAAMDGGARRGRGRKGPPTKGASWAAGVFHSRRTGGHTPHKAQEPGSGSSSRRGSPTHPAGAAGGGRQQRMGPPRWAGEFWNPLAEAAKSGQLANGGTGVFIPRTMQAGLTAISATAMGGGNRREE